MPYVVSSRSQVMRPNPVGGTFIASYQQRSTEVITYAVDYSKWVANGETVDSATLSVSPITTPDLVISAPEIQDGKRVLFQISEGLDASRYEVNINISTSDGQSKTDTFYIRIGPSRAQATWGSTIIPDPLPNPTAGTLGGVISAAAPANQFMTGVSLAGAPTFAQPAAANIFGLGDAATKNTGTTAGTLAAGDDSRITGAAQKSANLSDLASAATARTNLGAGVADGLATLDGTGKVPASQLPAAVTGSMTYQGTWNASTNTPAIPAAASGNKGYYYKVSVAGSTAIDGISEWKVGDWIISNGTTWDKIDNTDQVTSVAGKQGVVTLTAADISDSTAAGRALLVGADAAAQRTSLGLGDSATKNTGTGAGQVAAGDDARITGALPKAGGTMTGALTLTGGTSYIINGSGYFNAGATGGSSGHGIRDNSGVMESKNSGGDWTPIKEYFVALTSSRTLANNTSAQAIFAGGGGSTNGAITLPVGTYFFEGQLDISGLSSSSHTLSLGFAGTATIASILYTLNDDSALSQLKRVATAAATVYSAATTATTSFVQFSGVIRITGAGTIIPQITQNTASAAANILANSNFTIKALDVNGTTAYSGPWS